jgi:hypothetical protein
MGKHEYGTSQPEPGEKRITELEARVAELGRQLELAFTAEAILSRADVPGPAHAKPRRDRHGLRVIPGGLAALVPVPGHGAAAFLPAFGQVWLGRRAWPRWAMAAVALGLAMATEVPTAADVRESPAVVCADQCGAGEGGPQPLMRHQVHHVCGTDRLIMIRHDLGRA